MHSHTRYNDSMNSHETALWYIEESGGDLPSFLIGLEKRATIRYGQAFFNALTREDQIRLQGTMWDPFYSDEPFTAAMAINFLTKP